MKKLYSLFAAVVLTASVNAQTTSTLSITNAAIGGSAVLQSANYGGGAERTWTTNSIDFGGKAITGNTNNSPTSGTTAQTLIQSQGSNAVIYNVSALPGRIVKVTINYVGTARNFTLSGGSARLVNSTAADYTITGGTAVGSANTTGWTSTDLAGTNYTYFAVKNATSSTAYITSIDVVYENPTMAVGDINSTKANFIKNTVVDNNIIFAAKADVKIVSMNGQVVRTASVNENASLNVANLPKGMYIVTGTVNGKAVSEKIIKK